MTGWPDSLPAVSRCNTIISSGLNSSRTNGEWEVNRACEDLGRNTIDYSFLCMGWDCNFRFFHGENNRIPRISYN